MTKWEHNVLFQGWGNRKGDVYLRLCRPSPFDPIHVLIKAKNPGHSGTAPHDWEDVDITFTSQDEIVRRAQPGDHYQVMMNAGERNHQLFIKDFKLLIFGDEDKHANCPESPERWLPTFKPWKHWLRIFFLFTYLISVTNHSKLKRSKEIQKVMREMDE